MMRADWQWHGCLTLIGLALAVTVAPAQAGSSPHSDQQGWLKSFPVNKADLADQGRGPYYILVPGRRTVYQHGNEQLVITVLPETRMVDGVRTRVVEERETKGGQLVEVSHNFIAIDKKTGDAYYFGEDVDMYQNGKVTSHEGAWLSGVKGAHFGLMMPAKPTKGYRYHQEFAPGVAMDRAEIVSSTDSLRTPAGTFHNCVRTRESSAMESGSEEKLYAPGIGLVKDDKLVLVKVDRSTR